MPPRRTIVALISTLAACALLTGAPSAWAHAELEGSSPDSGATVATEPAQVIFKFNESVGGTFGAVRVYDDNGNEVDNSQVEHPGGNAHQLGVGLKRGLPDGTYTATYRVISADTHIVYGGLVFYIGHAGAAPKFTVAGLISRNESGEVTKLAFGAVRGVSNLATALLLGGLALLMLCWRPARSALPPDGERRTSALGAFESRFARICSAAIVAGLLASVLGILLQGASASGLSLWSALKAHLIGDTLESRFGWVWGVRALDWIAIALLLVLASRPRRGSGADAGRRVSTLPIAIGAAYLALTPALAGHASQESPVAVFLPSEIIHVLAASVWIGGIACLLIAVPAATRTLQPPERTRLLLGVLARFSPLALASVVALAITGVVQAYIDVRSLHSLLHSTYGTLVIIKVALLLVLIGLGAVNRERVIPGLKRLAGAGQAAGASGVLARRTMRGELALMVVVLGVTAALVSYTPPIDAESGPFATNTTIGPAELEMTLEPAHAGPNTIHLYLIDAKSGNQFTASKELTVTASLPAKDIGPLPLKANVSGPGHYTLNSAVLSPAGTWTITITDRTSEFDEYTRTIKVPIE